MDKGAKGSRARWFIRVEELIICKNLMEFEARRSVVVGGEHYIERSIGNGTLERSEGVENPCGEEVDS